MPDLSVLREGFKPAGEQALRTDSAGSSEPTVQRRGIPQEKSHGNSPGFQGFHLDISAL
jgi:hypothetical protein